MLKSVPIPCAKAGAVETLFPKIQGVKKYGSVPLGGQIGLRLGRVHEVMGAARDVFAMLAAGRGDGPVIWIGREREISSLVPGAAQRFLDPGRIILVEVTSRQEGLWACEQAMRLGRGGCVVSEMGKGPDLRESRRLQIAAEQSGCLGLVLIEACAQSSAAQMRWDCAPVCVEDADWMWHLTKNKAGQTGAWRVRLGEQDDGPDIIHMAAATAA